MRLIPALILCPLIAASSFPVFGAERQLPGRVIRVTDGDSLVLDVRGSHYAIDLAGIDAPEINQPWGSTATARLGRLLTGAFVVVETLHDGGTAQLSGTIHFKGRDVAYDLLHDGLAWSTRRSEDESDRAITTEPAPPADPYTAAEDLARLTRRGLWSDPQPVPPWIWRRLRGGHDGTDGRQPTQFAAPPSPTLR